VVRYVQGLWGIHIYKGRSSIGLGEVRKQTDVLLQFVFSPVCSTISQEESPNQQTDPCCNHWDEIGSRSKWGVI
jgi:hypothetical protein